MDLNDIEPKLGNISQTIVPIPNFFLNPQNRKLETFNNIPLAKSKLQQQSSPKKEGGKSNSLPKKTKPKLKSFYYRDRDLFTRNLDININHNPRINNRNTEVENSTKYVALYNRGKFPSNAEMKKTYFPSIIDNSISKTVYPTSEYEKFKDYFNKTNLNERVNPGLRNEIMNNTYHLLERINANYDLKRWSEFDSKVTFNRFYQTAYSPIYDYIKANKSDRDEFTETLRSKCESLRTLNPQAKEQLNQTLQKQKEKEMNAQKNKNLQNYQGESLDDLLEENKSNLLSIKKANEAPFEYNERDQKFLRENQYLTKTYQDTTLYKDLLTPNRIEFDEKKIRRPKKRFRINDVAGLVSKEGYSFQEKDLYNCQDELWSRPLHEDAFK